MFMYIFLFLPAGLALFKRTPRPDAVSVINGALDVNCSVSVCEGPLAPIYCHGSIIAAAYQFGVESWCPGKHLLFDPEIVVTNFEKLGYPLTNETFISFCRQNFEEYEYLTEVEPVDWNADPPQIQKVADPKHLRLALLINDRWKNLTRRFSDAVFSSPNRFPVIPVKNPFVVPGGFFEVYYYWDTFWIVKGLLHSGMVETVKGIIDNFADLVKSLGHIPNGGYIYLQRRSQPPMFVQMISDYFEVTKDLDSIKRWSVAMDLEMQFWLEHRSVQEGDARAMFHYRAESDCPRPENFISDFRLGELSGDPISTWRSMASACESGWDFSSRWFSHKGKRAFEKASIKTDTIIPVDLNVFMVRNFRIMSQFKKTMNDTKLEALYSNVASELEKLIHHLMWNNTEGVWMDLHMGTLMHRTAFYPSNVYPLMILNVTERELSKIKNYLHRNKVLTFPGGIPTTLPSKSSEQWDYPNVWAPNQHLFIHSLLKSGDNGLIQEGILQANKFITEVYNGVFEPAEGQKRGIWEKYNATTSDGRAGGGGEYPVQEGFGWTNGAVLDLIILLSNTSPKVRSEELPTDHGSLGGPPHIYFIGGVLTFVVCLALLFSLCGITNNMERYSHLREEDNVSQIALLAEEA